MTRPRWRGAGGLLRGACAAVALVLAAPPLLAVEFPDFTPQVSQEQSVVVSITTVSVARRSLAGASLDGDVDAVEDDAPDDVAQTGRRPVRGFASGVLISAEGHILTSAHVVRSLRETTIRLADGREYTGRVIGLDSVSDIALLKIDAARLPIARIGDPHALNVGDWVSAVGAPFGLEASVTAGIVSARRAMPGGGGLEMIQTDVAVNPGSSGSPLFNLHGEVVGINSMVYTTSGGYQGVSFALPIDTALAIARQLRERGRVVRGQLGVGVQEVTLPLAQAFGLPRTAGAVVVSVARGAPAESGGLRVGDILLGVDGRDDMSHAELQQAVANRPPGTTVRLNVWRGGAVRAIAVEVVEKGAPETVAQAEPHAGDRLGLVVADGAGTAAAGSGGNLLEVREAHGVALRAGLGAGDRIVRVNDTIVRGVADYRAALARVPADSYIALLVLRDGRMRYFALGDPGREH